MNVNMIYSKVCQCYNLSFVCQYGVSVRSVSTVCQYDLSVRCVSTVCQYCVSVRCVITFSELQLAINGWVRRSCADDLLAASTSKQSERKSAAVWRDSTWLVLS